MKESADLDILGVTFDSKMTFEKHLRSVSRETSRRLGILKKPWRVFHDRLLLRRCFRGFVLPVFEYCSAVWCLAADTHLRLLDRVVSGACFLAGGVLDCYLYIVDLWQYYVCCTRSDASRLWYSTGSVCASKGYTRCYGRTSVYLCASSLPNLTVLQDFYSPLSVSLEWS